MNYLQYNGGHAHLNWRQTMPKGLIALLGDTASLAQDAPTPDTASADVGR